MTPRNALTDERCKAVLIVHADVVPYFGASIAACELRAGHAEPGPARPHQWEREADLEAATSKAAEAKDEQLLRVGVGRFVKVTRIPTRRDGPDQNRQSGPDANRASEPL